MKPYPSHHPVLRCARRLATLTLGIVSLAMSAHATPTPWRTHLTDGRVIGQMVHRHHTVARTPAGTALPDVRLTTRVRGIGRIELKLTRLTTRYWSATTIDANGHPVADPVDVALFQGTATAHRGVASTTVPVAATLYTVAHTPRLKINLLVPTRVGRGRAVELRAAANLTRLRVRTAPTALLAHRSCGSATTAIDLPETVSPSAAMPPSASTTTLREIGLSAVADAGWRNRFGAAANAEIAAVVNAADVIFRDRLGLTFTIAATTDVTLSLSSNSEAALNTFATFATANLTGPNRDIQALFSTREFSENVIGIAYIGVVCRFPTFSASITTDFGPLTHLVFAHETGHNLDALHLSSCDDSIMCASIGNSTTTFSSPSINVISNYVATHGGCLATTQVPPTPSPTPTPPVSASPTPTPTPTATPTPNDRGSVPDPGPDLPTISLGATLTGAGRLTINVALNGTLLPGSTYLVLLSDNSSFVGFVRGRQFTPSLDGTARLVTIPGRGVKPRRDRSGRTVRQRVFILVMVQKDSAFTAAIRAVNPTRISRPQTTLRRWIDLSTTGLFIE